MTLNFRIRLAFEFHHWIVILLIGRFVECGLVTPDAPFITVSPLSSSAPQTVPWDLNGSSASVLRVGNKALEGVHS